MITFAASFLPFLIPIVKDFRQLGLSDEVLRVLTELGFEQPTDIQKQAIPFLLTEYRDLIGLAQTGTGKTAAFGLPLIERVSHEFPATQALILSPTRELCRQIHEQMEKYGKYLPKINILSVYGGAPIQTQIRALRNTQHIIVATPGRLIDLIHRRKIDLSQLAVVVLDEADEMLNMGFKEEIDEILATTPKDKMTWLFSATMPNEIKHIVREYMDDPLRVSIDRKQEVNVNITHRYALVRPRDKSEALMRFVDSEKDLRGIVFCRTRRDTQELAEKLLQRGYRVDALHGDMSQAQRDRTMKRFKEGSLAVLIATDVAARGIDVNDLTHVFHYSLPDDLAYYTHRSGRTARAGKSGESICLLPSQDMYKLKRLEKSLKITFNKATIPGAEAIASSRIEAWALSLLNTDGKKKVKKADPALVDKAIMLFGSLSKEELISKLVSAEVARLDLGSDNDLNQTDSWDGGGGGGRKRSGGRNRSGGGGYRGGGYRKGGGGRSGGGGRGDGRRDFRKKNSRGDGGGGYSGGKSNRNYRKKG